MTISSLSAIVTSFLTHYSIVKAANILGIGTEPKSNGTGLHALGTDENGHILIDKFEEKLKEFAKKDIRNVIVVGNAGTTMLGSVDNLPTMGQTITTIKKLYPSMSIHFHIDAAFGGFVIPFIESLPEIGFSVPEVDSIAIDAHKMGLSPYGSGIILARHKLFKRIESIAPYVPGNDCTLCGSRAGAMAISCWALMRKIGK